jgi:geranylgeranyl diphosphate synthase, type I
MPGVRNDDRQLVDATLERYLASSREDAEDAFELYEEIRRSISAGGKRLRPAFCLMGYRAGGGTDLEHAGRAAAALELLHCFALMHDDVMDGSPMRRGVASSHVALSELPDLIGDRSRFGVSAAILAGDMAMVLADRLWWETVGSSEAPNREYHRMREEVIAGQFLDLHASVTDEVTAERARRISILKSGRYTVERPLLIGATLAGASEEVLDMLRAYGPPVGEAFQLRDDILGAFGDPGTTGKDAFGDLREGKKTTLVAFARERADGDQSATLDEHLGNALLTEGGADQVRGVLRDTGSVDRVLQLIDDHLTRALEAVRSVELPAEVATGLVDLAQAAVSRQS